MLRTLGELVLSGNHMCDSSQGSGSSLVTVTWILGTVWEVLALCLAGKIAVKHFRELRQFSTGFTASDLFAVLLKTHLFYFAR
jgi:preprotein translocase subunit SecG